MTPCVRSQDLMCLKNSVIPASFGPEKRQGSCKYQLPLGQCDGLSLWTKKIKGLHKNELLR